MHIGIDLRLHAYAPGGIANYAWRLAEHLSPLFPAGALQLFQHRKESSALIAPGARAWRAWTPPHHRLERWAFGAEIIPARLDLLHSTDFIPPAWGARHRVITVHDLTFLHYPQYLTAESRRYYNDQIAWAVQKADAIIADSYATQRDLEACLGIAADRVKVIHLAADSRFRPLPVAEVEAGLQRYGLKPGYLLFVGTWEPRKNLRGLLDALALLHKRGEKRTLVIAGRPGWLYDEIFEHIKVLRLEAWVRFIEGIPAEDLVLLYNGALLLALPSFYEGFGLPALEALQCGTPAVVANRASLPEVIGEAGLLVNPEEPQTLAEACHQLAQDDRLRARLRTLGLERAAQFSWDKMARETLALYQHVLGETVP